MTGTAERTPAEWFAEATRWYVEGHQACPWCGARHCVFRSDANAKVEYHCSACDFWACRDRQTGHYLAVAGEQACTGALRAAV